MGSGSRCGCRALSELDQERTRHQATIEENFRYIHKIQDLHEELETLHNTVADLERRYSDLSVRYRKALGSLDEASDSKDRLKDHSMEISESNRKLKNTCERLQNELNELRDKYDEAKEEIEDEQRKRLAMEASLKRDLEEVDRSCHAHLRRAASIHELDAKHLKKDINKLQAALDKEKFRHNVTKRRLHHATLHISEVGAFCYCHDIDDCLRCYCLP